MFSLLINKKREKKSQNTKATVIFTPYIDVRVCEKQSFLGERNETCYCLLSNDLLIIIVKLRQF
jgi:hypothetical protein